MMRLSHLGSHLAPRFANKKQRQSAPIATLSQPMLDKLAVACRQQSTKTATITSTPEGINSNHEVTSNAPLIGAALAVTHECQAKHPLPRPAYLVTPFHPSHTRPMSTYAVASPITHSPIANPVLHGKHLKIKMQSPSELFLSSTGINSYLSSVYRTAGVAVGTSLGLSYLIATSALIPSSLFGPVLASSLAITAATAWLLQKGPKPETLQRRGSFKNINGSVMPSHTLYTENSIWRKMTWSTFIAASSVSMVPLVQIASTLNPFIVPVAAASSSVALLTASKYMSRSKSQTSNPYSGPAVGAIAGMAFVGATGSVALVTLGPSSALASLCLSFYPYMGVSLIAFMMHADARNAIAEYMQGQADHAKHAVTFYHNFGTLLMHAFRGGFRLVTP